MPASILTNWAKTSLGASYLNNVDADNNAVGATFYIILMLNTFPGFAGTSDPDKENTADAAYATHLVAPVAGGAGYTGNGVARGQFRLTKDLTLDRALFEFLANPVIVAGATAINNVRGFMIATANSITSGRVISIIRFDQVYAIGATQQATITNAGILLT